MIATEPIAISEEYRKIALQGEPILDNSQGIVIISMQSFRNYEELAKIKRNAELFEELERRSDRLANGEGIHKTLEELEAMENE